jgi:hypothetical protein
MTVASFIASQRADQSVPHVISCQALSVSQSWFYKWHDRPPTPRQLRRQSLDQAVKRSFEDSGGTYRSPRVATDLREEGWRVSEKTVAASWPPRASWRAPSGAGDPSRGPTRRPNPFQTC